MEKQNRRLAAILFTDIVGSTSMMQKNEQVAISVHKKYISVLKKSLLARGGEILNDFGDGSLCTFHSATEALRFAVDIQQQFQIEPKVPLRVGLHVGEIFFEDEKVFGDGVNVASRIQSLGIANSILFSPVVKNEIKNQENFTCISLGKFHFKNVEEPMEVFALTNAGLDVPARKNIEGKLKSKKDYRKKNFLFLFAFIVLAIVSFFMFKARQEKALNTIKSIAVLPFLNGSSDKENEYLGDGIAQEIIAQISKINSIQVIGWASSVSFKNIHETLKQKADALGVQTIVTGSVQKEGNKVLITVELTEGVSGKRLWGEEYNRQWGDILNIQTEVAQKIADALDAKLTPEEKSGIARHYTENVEAYKFYRKGRFFWDQRTKESFDSAEIYYKKAIALDPDYALAYSGLADLYIYPNNGLSQVEAMPIAKQYATKAFLLDSTLSEALTTLGFIQSAFDYDWINSKKTLEKAIALNPNYPTAHLYYGNLLEYTGENTAQGISEIKKALVLDPLAFNLNYVLGRNYYAAHQFDSAYDQLRKTLTINPGFNLAKGNLAYTCLAEKKFNEAFKVIQQIDKTGTSKIYYYQALVQCYADAFTGNIALAKSELEKILASNEGQYWSPYHVASIYILLKDYDAAFAMLEKAYKARDLWMYFLNVDPAFDAIRNDPRFKTLLRKMNFG